MDYLQNCIKTLGLIERIKLVDDNKLQINNDLIFSIKFNADTCELVGQDLISTHIVRIANKKFSEKSLDTLYDILPFIIALISSNTVYQFCTICAISLNLPANHPITCQTCKEISCQYWTNDIITDTYKQNANMLYFLIDTFSYALKSPKRDTILNPFPNFIKNKKYDKLEEFIAKYKYDQFNKFMSTCDNDLDIINKFGIEFYSLLKFIVTSNTAQLKPLKLLDSKNDTMETKIDIYNDVMYYEVVHDIIKQNKFKHEQPDFLYHGSGCSNWFSILRNGLKNCSGTAMMANGAAYGNGIYLANTSNLSYNYCRDRNGNNGDYFVMGIVQLLYDRKQYHKGGNVFVIPDESALILKYLIIIPNKKLDICKDIDTYFNQKRADIIASSMAMINLSSKRIQKEFNIIQKKYKNIKIDQTNNNNWIVEVNNIKFKILFDNSYPIYPPIVYLLTDIMSHNNVINQQNLLIQYIAPKYWTSMNKMESVIDELIRIATDSKIKSQIIDENLDMIVSNYNNLVKQLEWC